MDKKLNNDLDIICYNRIEDILEWAQDNKWFDASFVIKMSKQNTWSAGQRLAIENIYFLKKIIKKNYQ